MSVVVGIIMDGTVLLAADQRMVNLNTHDVTSETHKKILPINDTVAISVVGNAGLSLAILATIQNGNKDQDLEAIKNASVDDYCQIVDICVESIKENMDVYSDDLSCTIIVAGKNKDGNAIIKWRNNQEPLLAQRTEEKDSIAPVMFNPTDMTWEQCIELLKQSIDKFRFKNGGIIAALQDAVKSISAISHSVNDHVDIWMCDAAKIINQK